MTAGIKPYAVTLDILPADEQKLKRFVSLTGYKSVREFIKLAIKEKIKNDLNGMPSEDRRSVSALMDKR